MLFEITYISFNEPDYVTLQSVINIMAENGAKVTKNGVTMVFSYSCVVPFRKRLLQTENCGCYCLVNLLCMDFFYLNLLKHG